MFNAKERKIERMRSTIADVLSPQTYNLVIGACLFYGFLVNALIVGFAGPFIAAMNPIAFIIGYFVSCLVGIFMTRSRSAAMSFLGYNFVVVPIGAVVAVCLPAYYVTDVLAAIVVTGAVTLAMMVLSASFPNLFSKMGGALFAALLVAIIAELVAMFFGYSGQIFNWLFVIIFSLYIGYDWHKAQMYPKTLDNAVDSALDLYLDIINLFIRLLQIISRSRK